MTPGHDLLPFFAPVARCIGQPGVALVVVVELALGPDALPERVVQAKEVAQLVGQRVARISRVVARERLVFNEHAPLVGRRLDRDPELGLRHGKHGPAKHCLPVVHERFADDDVDLVSRVGRVRRLDRFLVLRHAPVLLFVGDVFGFAGQHNLEPGVDGLVKRGAGFAPVFFVLCLDAA